MKWLAVGLALVFAVVPGCSDDDSSPSAVDGGHAQGGDGSVATAHDMDAGTDAGALMDARPNQEGDAASQFDGSISGDGQAGSDSAVADDRVVALSGDCALKADGTVFCRDVDQQDITAVRQIPGIEHATQISGSSGDLCAVIRDGSVRCFGSATVGELGDGNIREGQVDSAVTVMGVNNAVEVAVAGQHACVRLSDGTARCWGSSLHGELGAVAAVTAECTTAPLSKGPCSPVPVAVDGVSDLVQLSLSTGKSCGLHADGTVVCWGSVYQYPGAFAADGSTTVTAVAGLQAAVRVTLSSVISPGAPIGEPSCALQHDGTALCWGGEQVGDPPPASLRPFPNLTGAVELVRGAAHWCARYADGTVGCAGDNSAGQLGDGTGQSSTVGTSTFYVPAFTSSATPKLVPGIASAVQLSVGDNHTCALLADATTWCWGERELGFYVEDPTQGVTICTLMQGVGGTGPRCAPRPIQVDW